MDAPPLRKLIDDHRERLTPADRRLLDTLLGSPEEASFLTSTALAARAGVNQAAAVRLAKKLGFHGYPNLRAHLREEFLGRSEPALRVERKLSGSHGAVLDSLIGSEIAALDTLRHHVTQREIDTAAAALVGAERIFLFAQGHATSLAELMDRRLRRAGAATIVLTGQGRELAERVVGMTSADALLAFAFHATPRGLRPALAHAGRVGAKSILISDLVGLSVRPAPDLLIAAPRGPEAEFQTLSVPMLVCNALVLTLARLDRSRSVHTLDRLSELIKQFDQET